MNSKRNSKLSLSRESLRILEEGDLREAAGGAIHIPKTRAISICFACTTPLDGCPSATIA